MTLNEQKAFLNAYATNVANISREKALKILDSILSDTVDCHNVPEGYSSVMDALGIWHDAIKYYLDQKG